MGGSKKGGGLICYTRDSLNANDCKFSHLNCSTRDLEMQWVLLEMPRMRNLVIVNIYRPLQGDYKVACRNIHEAVRKAVVKDTVEIFWGTLIST